MNRLLILILLLFVFSTPLYAQTEILSNTILNIVLIVIVIIQFIIIILFLIKKQQIETNPKYIEIKKDFEIERNEKNKLQGSSNELSQNNASLKAENNQRQQTINELRTKITKFESEETRRKKDFEQKVSELENSRKALEDERNRVIKEDEERKKEIEENRDRIWKLHEQESIIKMTEICHKRDLVFTCYDNNNLPEDFDTSFNPDFLVEFLGQYIIFDTKLSKAKKNLQNYLAGQAKKTAIKIKKSSSFSDIYSHIFFVIPSIEVQNVKTFIYNEGTLTFYVIPVEAFEPIIYIFKKCESYDLAGKYDPQEREKIINLIAAFDNHIRHQNATNILNTIRGLKVLKEKENVPDEIVNEIETKIKSIRLENFKPNELKKLISNPEEQIKEVIKMIKPKLPPIDEDDINEAQESNSK